MYQALLVIRLNLSLKKIKDKNLEVQRERRLFYLLIIVKKAPGPGAY